MLGLRFCERAFSSCGERGPLFIAVRGPLTIAASLAAEHRLQMRRLSSCGSRAQLLGGMWDPPRPGLEPVSPALAGGFLTTAPPGKPLISLFAHPQAWSPSLLLTWGGPDSHPIILFYLHGPQNPPDTVPKFKFLSSQGSSLSTPDCPQPWRGENFTNHLPGHLLPAPSQTPVEAALTAKVRRAPAKGLPLSGTSQQSSVLLGAVDSSLTH